MIKMRTRYDYLKTGAVICSLIAVPNFIQLVGAQPDKGLKSKDKGQETDEKVEAGVSVDITVKGLACPFCVHGLGKKLKKIEGVQTVDIKLKTGVARLTFDKGVEPDEKVLRKAIKKAGFTAGEIKASGS